MIGSDPDEGGGESTKSSRGHSSGSGEQQITIGVAQRRSPPTPSTSVSRPQMNIIKEDSVEK